jgi:membrane protein implicated in regulation of membrane protease activity
MLWLGLAAIIVGILQLAIGIDLSIQLIVWLTLSTIFLLFWHKFIYSKA